MHRGYVKLWRRTTDSAVFLSKTNGLFRVWAWCLMRAAYKPRVVSITSGRGSIEVELEPGQFVFGRHSAAKEIPGLTSEMVRKRMEKLKEMQKLTIETTSHYSVVTICNWGLYQEDDIQDDHLKNQPKTSQKPAVTQDAVTTCGTTQVADDQPTTSRRPADDQLNINEATSQTGDVTLGDEPSSNQQQLDNDHGVQRGVCPPPVSHPPYFRPQTRSKEERRKKKEEKARARAGDYDPLFEQFWQTVPPRKRGGKQDAARAYRVAVGLLKGRGPDPHKFLREQAQAYYASPLGQTQFCSGAAPFLRQGHYDDDPRAWERNDDQTRRKPDGRIR